VRRTFAGVSQGIKLSSAALQQEGHASSQGTPESDEQYFQLQKVLSDRDLEIKTLRVEIQRRDQTIESLKKALEVAGVSTDGLNHGGGEGGLEPSAALVGVLSHKYKDLRSLAALSLFNTRHCMRLAGGVAVPSDILWMASPPPEGGGCSFGRTSPLGDSSGASCSSPSPTKPFTKGVSSGESGEDDTHRRAWERTTSLLLGAAESGNARLLRWTLEDPEQSETETRSSGSSSSGAETDEKEKDTQEVKLPRPVDMSARIPSVTPGAPKGATVFFWEALQEEAAYNGKLEFLQVLASEGGQPPDAVAAESAGRGGHVEILEWMAGPEVGVLQKPEMAAAAVEGAREEGQKKVLVWLQDKGLLV